MTAALGVSSLPAETPDAHIYTIARLYSFGTHGNGDGPELADCMITTADYDAFYTDLTGQFSAVPNVHLRSYSSYPSVKQLLLAPRADDATAVEIFVQTCVEHKGVPHQYN